MLISKLISFFERVISFVKRRIRFFTKKSNSINKIKKENSSIHNSLVLLEPYGLNIETEYTRVDIEPNVYFRKFCNITVVNNGQLFIGSNVFFNNYCSINCLGKIRIGKNSLFGEGVKIYDHNHLHSFVNNTLSVSRQEYDIGFVNIGENCWIGSNVTILKNVTIGDNVIIGANNLIYKSIPSNVIVKKKSEIIIESLQNFK